MQWKSIISCISCTVAGFPRGKIKIILIILTPLQPLRRGWLWLLECLIDVHVGCPEFLLQFFLEFHPVLWSWPVFVIIFSPCLKRGKKYNISFPKKKGKYGHGTFFCVVPCVFMTQFSFLLETMCQPLMGSIKIDFWIVSRSKQLHKRGNNLMLKANG